MDTERMDGKTVAISGGSSGVGLAVATGLAGLGARTLVLSRSEPNGRRAVDAIRALHPAADVEVVVGTLDASESAERLAEQVLSRTDRLDVLVSTAGSVGESGVTASGIPRAFATNYLTHYLLLRSLLPTLGSTRGSRALVVGVAPALAKRIKKVRLDGIDASASQTAATTQAIAWKLLLARHLADTHPDGPTVNVFHPGLIRSNLLAGSSAPLRLVGTIMNRFASERCAVAEYLASAQAVGALNGRLIDNHARVVELPALGDAESPAAVWRASALLAP